MDAKKDLKRHAEAKAGYRTRETEALQKILALGTRQIEEGKVRPAKDVIKRLRERKRNHCHE
jgi:hypothetical protein